MAGSVVLQKVDRENIFDAVEKSIELLGGMKRFISSGKPVLIKPNLGIDLDWQTGATTHPAIVEALILLLKKAGAQRVMIGEGTTVGLDTQKVFEKTGYLELSKKHKVELIDFRKAEAVMVDVPNGKVFKKLPIPAEFFNWTIINLPVLKTHNHTLVTLSLKNMKGFLPDWGKRRNHLVGLEEGIVDFNKVLKSDLIIVDGIVGQEGLGPVNGTPVNMNLLIGGTNAVEVDTVCAALMGIKADEVIHLKGAAEAGLGEKILNKINIFGEEITKIRREFKRPPAKLMDFYEGIRIFGDSACSACVGGIIAALERMRKNGELEKLKAEHKGLNILSGAREDIPAELSNAPWVIIGSCQRRYKNKGTYIPGCPPPGYLVRDTLRELIGLPGLHGPKDFLDQEKVHLEKGTDFFSGACPD